MINRGVKGEVDAGNRPRRLLDQVRDVLRRRHYAYRAEKSYVGWIRKFILFHGQHWEEYAQRLAHKSREGDVMILGLRTAMCHAKDLDAAGAASPCLEASWLRPIEARDLVRLLRQYTMTLGIASPAMVAGLAGATAGTWRHRPYPGRILRGGRPPRSNGARSRPGSAAQDSPGCAMTPLISASTRSGRACATIWPTPGNRSMLTIGTFCNAPRWTSGSRMASSLP